MNTTSKNKSYKPSPSHPWVKSNPYAKRPVADKVFLGYIFEADPKRFKPLISRKEGVV